MRLVARLSTLARRSGYQGLPEDFTGWNAQPLQVRAVQTNGYDCGMWVLAVILSVLQGHETTSMGESHIEALRSCILHLILQLEIE